VNEAKRMTIKKILLLSFLAFAVLMAIIGSISVYNIRHCPKLRYLICDE